MPEQRLEELKLKIEELSKAADECREKIRHHRRSGLGINGKIKLLTASALIGVSVRLAGALMGKFLK